LYLSDGPDYVGHQKRGFGRYAPGLPARWIQTRDLEPILGLDVFRELFAIYCYFQLPTATNAAQ
jgi:hypothetical protein